MSRFLSSLVVLQTETNGELPVDEGTFLLIALVSTLIFLVIAAGVGYWMYKDASKRENNEVAWAVGTAGLLFFFLPAGIIAIVAYLILRGEASPPESEQERTSGEEW